MTIDDAKILVEAYMETNRLSEYQRKFNRKISRLIREHVKMSEWYAPSQHEYIGNL